MEGASQIGAVETRVIGVEFEPVELDLDHSHAQLRAVDGKHWHPSVLLWILLLARQEKSGL
jgi:hypothetical protein